jgi:hypothetical protein
VQARSAGTVKLEPAGLLGSAPALSVSARRVPRVRALGSWWLLLAGALLALVLGTAVHESFPGGRSVGAAHVRAHGFSHAGLLSLPVAARGPVSAALGAEGRAYRVSRSGGRFTASSPVQRLSASFTRSGMSVRSGPTEVGLGLLAVGYGSALAPLAQVAPSAHANRVLYRHPGLDEWYANGPLGLEQGFTIHRAPSGHAAGPLTLSMLLSGDVKASLAKGGQNVVIGRAGRALLRYTGLHATDAGGRALHSWLQLDGGRLLLRVDAAGVRYPLRIDPLIQQGEKLTGAGAIGTGRFGYSVALSGDGDTALIGGRYESPDAGAAWVFTRSGSTWTQQGGKLVGTGHVGEGEFGESVALSADGDTALIGGPTDNSDTGAAWVFTRSGSTWTQQGGKLTGTGETGKGEFGESVTLSADGDTALIGGWRDDGGAGAAWAFVEPPTPTTGAATSLGETSATLNGTFGAGGSSTAYFQYGATASYGASTATQSVGASSSSSPLAAAIGGLAPGATYHFRLVGENSGGVVYGGDQTLTTAVRGATSTTETITTPPAHVASTSSSAPSETPLPPAVQNARQSTTRWREGNRLARVSRAKTPTGTTFSFSLGEQATVAFSFAQRVSGRKVGVECVTQTAKNRRKPACMRTTTAGTLTFTGHSGTNKVAFQGRISPVKKLKPGRYTLVITATNSAGARSAPQSLSFTIVK